MDNYTTFKIKALRNHATINTLGWRFHFTFKIYENDPRTTNDALRIMWHDEYKWTIESRKK